jgi:hypothetical protein
MESGSHWMLAELDLTSDEVAIGARPDFG